MERKNISQPEEAWAAWDRQAAAMDMTLSGLIFEAMNEHLGALPASQNQKAAKVQAGGSEAQEGR